MDDEGHPGQKPPEGSQRPETRRPRGRQKKHPKLTEHWPKTPHKGKAKGKTSPGPSAPRRRKKRNAPHERRKKRNAPQDIQMERDTPQNAPRNAPQRRPTREAKTKSHDGSKGRLTHPHRDLGGRLTEGEVAPESWRRQEEPLSQRRPPRREDGRLGALPEQSGGSDSRADWWRRWEVLT